MDVKIFILAVLFVASCFYNVDADFLYNRVLPKTTEEALAQGYKCIPGRTFIKIGNTEPKPNNATSFGEDVLRSHMRFHTDDESCQICVCSVEGKDKNCSNRPAKNVNECIMMANVMKRFNKSLPFDHETSLLVRRDGRVGKNFNGGEQCIPFVSVYTDCTEENQCDGCKSCVCNANSEWMCEDVKQCDADNIHPETDLDDQAVEDALDTMLDEIRAKESQVQLNSNTPLVPRPPSADEERELDDREVLLGYIIGVRKPTYY